MNADRVKRSIKDHEGLVLKPYRDHLGVLTIGYGRNLTHGITMDEAEYLFDNDFWRSVVTARAICPMFDRLDDVRREVLIEMAFQLGASGLAGFKNMLSAINGGDHNAAADEMVDSKWATQTPIRAARLAERMRSGKCQE